MPLTIVGYLAGTLRWCSIAAAAIGLLRTRLTPRFSMVIDAICDSVMLAVAGKIALEDAAVAKLNGNRSGRGRP